MTDHPLVPHDIKAYIERYQLEDYLNKALNTVLVEMPQDPFSTMAVKLLESNSANPIIDHIQASETFICDL